MGAVLPPAARAAAGRASLASACTHPLPVPCRPAAPQVGRPRPHFVNRCWPNGLKPVFSPEGVPLCADTAIDPMEGIKVGGTAAADICV